LHALERGEAGAAAFAWRRRRIEVLSSVGRLSFTWLLSWAQNGQRKRSELRVDGETGEVGHGIAHALFHWPSPSLAIAGKAIHHLGDELADLADFPRGSRAWCPPGCPGECPR
jgi:hypothetical protein